MTHDAHGGLDRRETLKCMLWAGTGVVWTVAGGAPSSPLIGSAKAGTSGFSVVQISDSHIGFAKPANPRCALNAQRRDRQNSCDAREARVHDSHRRHQPHREGGPVR